MLWEEASEFSKEGVRYTLEAITLVVSEGLAARLLDDFPRKNGCVDRAERRRWGFKATNDAGSVPTARLDVEASILARLVYER